MTKVKQGRQHIALVSPPAIDDGVAFCYPTAMFGHSIGRMSDVKVPSVIATEPLHP